MEATQKSNVFHSIGVTTQKSDDCVKYLFYIFNLLSLVFYFKSLDFVKNCNFFV